jgi:hypothetical protein
VLTGGADGARLDASTRALIDAIRSQP